MSQQTNEPLRGEAAFRAAKERVEKANDAAYARGRKERDAENAAALMRRRDVEKQGMRGVPKQPHPH
jgi:hypothetical protein